MRRFGPATGDGLSPTVQSIGMTVAGEIALFDWVELTEPVGAAEPGWRGGVIEFPSDGVALVEVMQPDLDDVLDRLVYAPLSALRSIDRP